MDSIETNREKSERLVAAILVNLLDRGLRSGDLSLSQLGLNEDYQPFFLNSVRWLESEGIIRYSNIADFMNGSGTVFDPVLTSLGFRLLGSELSLSDGSKVETEEAVRKVVASEGQYSKAGSFVGGLLGSFTKAISG